MFNIKSTSVSTGGQCVSILLKFNMSNETAGMKGSVG